MAFEQDDLDPPLSALWVVTLVLAGLWLALGAFALWWWF
jgi:hypothetical protein